MQLRGHFAHVFGMVGSVFSVVRLLFNSLCDLFAQLPRMAFSRASLVLQSSLRSWFALCSAMRSRCRIRRSIGVRSAFTINAPKIYRELQTEGSGRSGLQSSKDFPPPGARAFFLSVPLQLQLLPIADDHRPPDPLAYLIPYFCTSTFFRLSNLNRTF